MQRPQKHFCCLHFPETHQCLHEKLGPIYDAESPKVPHKVFVVLHATWMGHGPPIIKARNIKRGHSVTKQSHCTQGFISWPRAPSASYFKPCRKHDKRPSGLLWVENEVAKPGANCGEVWEMGGGWFRDPGAYCRESGGARRFSPISLQSRQDDTHPLLFTHVKCKI